MVLLAACEPAPLDDGEAYQGGGAVPLCTANNDGVIEAAEMPFATDVVARVRVAEGELDVDVKGRVEEGVRTWDFTRPDPEEEPLAQHSASPLERHWFAGEYPSAQYAGAGNAAQDLLLPLSVHDDGIRLHGLASADEEPAAGKTLLVYDEPLSLYPFPLHEGVKQTSTASASDVLLYGLPTALTDRLEVEVTGRGTLRLPDLVLENTLRVTLRSERTLVIGDARTVTHVFLHECLGEVARVASPSVPLAQDISDDFETAASIWRLSL